MFPFRKTRRVSRAEVRSRPTVRLQLEELEDRQLLSTVATAGPTEVFVIRPDQSVWENIGFGWVALSGSGFAGSITAVSEPVVGDFVLFALTPGGTIFSYRSSIGWNVVGSTFTSMSAGTDPSGFADLFALTGTGGTLYEFNNSGVFSLGNDIVSFSASNNGIVSATLTNNAVWAFDPNIGWFALSSAGFANQVSMQINAATGFQVVFADSPGGTVHQWMANTGWITLGGVFRTISAGQDLNGNADVLALTAKNGLFEFNQSPTRATFVGNFAADVAATLDDREFVILTNGAVWGHDTRVGWFQMTSPGFAQP